MKHRSTLAKYITSNFFNVGINLFFQVMSLPLLMNHWGLLLYKDWLILTSVIGFLSIIDFGLVSYTSNLVVFNHSLKKYKLNNILYTNLFIFIFLAFISVYIIFLLSNHFFNHNLSSFFDIMSPSTFFLSFTVLFLATLFNTLNSLLSIVYRVNYNFVRSLNFDNFSRIFEIILFVSSVLLNFEFITVIILYSVPKLFVFIFKIIDLRKLNYIQKLPFSYSPYILSQSLKSSVSFSYMSITNFNYLNLIPIIIGSKFAAYELVQFTTIRTFINFLKVVLNVIGNSIWPFFTYILSNNDKKSITKYHFLIVNIAFFSTLFFSIIILLFGENIYNLWSNKTISFNFMIVLAMIISAILFNLWSSSSIVLASSNNQNVFATSYLFLSVFNVLLITILVRFKSSIELVSYTFIFVDIIMLFVVTSSVIKYLKLGIYFYIIHMFSTTLIISELRKIFKSGLIKIRNS